MIQARSIHSRNLRRINTPPYQVFMASQACYELTFTSNENGENEFELSMQE
jgi:hypothetical protein